MSVRRRKAGTASGSTDVVHEDPGDTDGGVPEMTVDQAIQMGMKVRARQNPLKDKLVVVTHPDGRICVLCKVSDTTMDQSLKT